MFTSPRFAATAMFAIALAVSSADLAAGGLATSATARPSPTQSPGRTGVSANSNNVNAQILINTLNALSSQQNTATPSDTSYEAPAPRRVEPTPTYRAPVATLPQALVTSDGYNCEDSLRSSIARAQPNFTSDQSSTAARALWENEYRMINSSYASALRSELVRTNDELSDHCLSGAITARLEALGWGPQAIAATHKSKFDAIVSRSITERDNGSGKKRLVLKQYPNCLRVNDVRLDHDVKDMYWYNIVNTCGQSVQAHWCEGKGCKPTDRAADIGAGEKEESWMLAHSRSEVRFRGTACATEYQGHDVQYDKNRNECWVWAE